MASSVGTCNDETWLEQFEQELGDNENETFLNYSQQLLSRDDLTADIIAADPLVLMKADLKSFTTQKLEVALRVSQPYCNVPNYY